MGDGGKKEKNILLKTVFLILIFFFCLFFHFVFFTDVISSRKIPFELSIHISLKYQESPSILLSQSDGYSFMSCNDRISLFLFRSYSAFILLLFFHLFLYFSVFCASTYVYVRYAWKRNLLQDVDGSRENYLVFD